MNRIFKIKNEYDYFWIDLGNIKTISTSDIGNMVHVYLLRGYEYITLPNNYEKELNEPILEFTFDSDKKKFEFANTLIKAWEEYLEENNN